MLCIKLTLAVFPFHHFFLFFVMVATFFFFFFDGFLLFIIKFLFPELRWNGLENVYLFHEKLTPVSWYALRWNTHSYKRHKQTVTITLSVFGKSWDKKNWSRVRYGFFHWILTFFYFEKNLIWHSLAIEGKADSKQV
jgi:hypothetical protein